MEVSFVKMASGKFELGRLVLTSGAMLDIPGEAIMDGLRRHRNGDWGDLDDEDKAANDAALAHGGRLLSVYHCGETKFWIITEWDRSATTILLPDEY